MIQFIIDIMIIIFNPMFWFMNYSYSENWDRKFNILMNDYKFEDIKFHAGYYAKLGHEDIWIQNYPYACFTKGSFRPSRLTILKAKRKLKKDLMSVSELRDYNLKKLGI